MPDVVIRPMLASDVRAAEQLSDDAFFELDQRTRLPGAPAPERRTPEHSAQWTSRTLRFLEHDAEGCWVAEDAFGLVGLATSFVRGSVWCLSTYAVRPDHQGAGVGKRLLEAAEAYAVGCTGGLLSASSDPRALRRYWRAGFALHPQMFLRGVVDRRVLPAVEGVREASPGDIAMMDALAAEHRGGGHETDHETLAETGRPLIAETSSGRGFAYTDGARLSLLAATDEATAVALLTACLADAGGTYLVPHVTGANQGAVDVSLGAGLELAQSGYLGVRGMAPPSPYVHNGALL